MLLGFFLQEDAHVHVKEFGHTGHEAMFKNSIRIYIYAQSKII